MNKPHVMSKIGKSSKGRPIGSKNKNTIYADQLRELFVNEVSEEWAELVKAEIKDAKKNYRARHFIFEQVMGKSKEAIEVETNQGYNLNEDLMRQINKLYGKQED